MTPRDFVKLLDEQGPREAYHQLTGRADWAERLARMIPDHMQRSVVRWIAFGPRSQPGSFLAAVLMDSLFDAVAKADVVNEARLRDYVMFFYNYAPSGARHYGTWAGLIEEEKVQ